MSSQKPKTRGGRVLRIAGQIVVTLLFVVVSIGALLAGRAVLAERLGEEVARAPAPLTSVQVDHAVLQSSYTLTRHYAGQFEAPQTTALAFEEGGTLAEITVQEGDVVGAGDVIARLDTRLLQAERDRLLASRAAIAAQAELARRTNERQTELMARGHASDQMVDDTSLALVRLDAQIAEIDAGLAALDVRLSKSALLAPFAGIVGDRLVDVGAIAGPGAPIVTVLEDADVLFRAGIDPSQIAQLQDASGLTVRFGDTALAARFDRLAPELDLSTRAQTAFFTVEGPAPPPGSAAEVALAVDVATATPGTWLPLAALRQGPRGSWQVLIITNGSQGPEASVAAVELIHTTDTSAFVTGTLQDGQAFITGGTHRVVPGERVAVAAHPVEVASWVD